MITIDHVQWFHALEPGDELAIRAYSSSLPPTIDYGRWYRAIVQRSDKRGHWVRRVGSGSEARVTPTSIEWDARPWSPMDDARELAISNDQSLREWLRDVVYCRRADGRYEALDPDLRAELLAVRERLSC